MRERGDGFRFFIILGVGHRLDRDDAFVEWNLRERTLRSGIVQEKENALLSGVTRHLKALLKGDLFRQYKRPCK